MALYWPEARFALDLMEGTHEEAREGEKYPDGTLVISVREEQVDDAEFLEEMRQLIIKRTLRFEKGDAAPAPAESAKGGCGHAIPTIADIFEGLVAAEDAGCRNHCDDCGEDDPDDLLEDYLGHALEIGYGLAAQGAPQVQLVINGCRDVIVKPEQACA